MQDDPPRYMGEGFVILSSNNVELYYYMDEPGLVPEEPLMLRLANGDIVESAPPIWGLDIKVCLFIWLNNLMNCLSILIIDGFCFYCIAIVSAFRFGNLAQCV
jgi:hypothetical protein